jgi:predicted nucleic-acid-binding Zn-ribbon protein
MPSTTLGYISEIEMQHDKWECPKCQNKEFETDLFSATGGFLTKFMNIQSKKFTTVTCTRCKYTEIYKTKTSALGNVLDFFGN